MSTITDPGFMLPTAMHRIEIEQMRQRFGIAQALIGQPSSVLFANEQEWKETTGNAYARTEPGGTHDLECRFRRADGTTFLGRTRGRRQRLGRRRDQGLEGEPVVGRRRTVESAAREHHRGQHPGGGGREHHPESRLPAGGPQRQGGLAERARDRGQGVIAHRVDDRDDGEGQRQAGPARADAALRAGGRRHLLQNLDNLRREAVGRDMELTVDAVQVVDGLLDQRCLQTLPLPCCRR